MTNKKTKTMKKFIITTLIAFSLLIGINKLTAQVPPPPPAHDQTGNQEGGRAPIGSGLFILIGLGAAYGSKRMYEIHKEKSEE